MASRADIEERLRPLVDGVEEFIVKPFLVKDLVRITKKVVDRLHLEKMQKHAARPGIIQGRLEEMSMTDLLQSLEMGRKSGSLTLTNRSPVLMPSCPMASSGVRPHASPAPMPAFSRVRRSIIISP